LSGVVDLSLCSFFWMSESCPKQVLFLLHRLGRFPVQVLVLDPLGELRHGAT